MKNEVDAKGLSTQEIQTAIDRFIETKKSTYIPQKLAELEQLDREIKELEAKRDAV